MTTSGQHPAQGGATDAQDNGAHGKPDPIALQRKTLRVIVTAQVLSGLTSGSAFALGSILAERFVSATVAGLPSTAMTFGAALAAIPLARLATMRGRRISLSSGLVCGVVGLLVLIAAVELRSFALLLLGMVGVGMSNAVNLQARFAAADLSVPRRRGRDISLVVWTTSFGTIAGPNLLGVGGWLGDRFGLDRMSGPFLIPLVTMALAVIVLNVGLRPDPLLTARELAASSRVSLPPTRGARAILRSVPVARLSVAAAVVANGLMVAVMAMMPVHMTHGGATITIVGIAVSLHIAGMYLLSPLFGLLVDSFSAEWVIASGMALNVAACAMAAVSGSSLVWLTVALTLVGLGWSAVTVGAAALLTSSVDVHDRAPIQGFSDSVMSLAGAFGGAISGVVVGLSSFPTLAWACSVIAVVALLTTLRSRPVTTPP